MTTKYAVGTEYCDDALDCHQYSQVLELAKSLHFINNAELLRKHTWDFHRILS